MEMSIAVMTSSLTSRNRWASNVSSSRRNFSRLMLARLHEELSRWTYSLHGLLAVIRPDSGQVCQSLMVPSYWIPGSAQAQAAWAIVRNRLRASTVSTVSPVSRAARSNLPPASTARMKSSETRTELFAFWYWTLAMSLPPRSMSKPPSRRTRIFSSSRALVSMNSSMSGWSTSRTTIFAARRVAPPDLMVPADASAPRMNETGPLAVPPEESSSLEDRIRDRLTPAPEPPLKIRPSSLYQSRIESIVSSTARMKQLCTRRLPERYSPLSVWMSKTSIGPRFSTLLMSTSIRSDPPTSGWTYSKWSPGRRNPATVNSPVSASAARHTR